MAVVDGCMVGLTMEEAQHSRGVFFYPTANSNHSKDGDSIKVHDNKKAESFLCNKSTAQLYVARHRGFPLYTSNACEGVHPKAGSFKRTQRKRAKYGFETEILAEFLPQSAAITETLSGARC